MTDHEAVAKVLLDAADLIERDGWVQGLGTDGVRHCAMHALGVALGDTLETVEMGQTLFACAARLNGLLGIESVIRWNDAPGRTKQEVLDAFQAAAKAELRLTDGADS